MCYRSFIFAFRPLSLSIHPAHIDINPLMTSLNVINQNENPIRHGGGLIDCIIAKDQYVDDPCPVYALCPLYTRGTKQSTFNVTDGGGRQSIKIVYLSSGMKYRSYI